MYFWEIYSFRQYVVFHLFSYVAFDFRRYCHTPWNYFTDRANNYMLIKLSNLDRTDYINISFEAFCDSIDCTLDGIWPIVCILIKYISIDVNVISDRKVSILLRNFFIDVLARLLHKGIKISSIIDGTTDITVHEKLPSGKLKELNKASGGGCGGKAVDNEFFKLLDEWFGTDIMKRFKEEYHKNFLRLHRKFENVKRSVTSKMSIDKHIEFPYAAFCRIMGSSKNFDHYCERESIKMVKGKLVLSSSTLKTLFEPTINNILSNIELALNSKHLANVSMIILVGGFAKSQLLQTAIRDKFKGMRIIVPEDAGLAVLKGAVLYGHNPETIDPRVSRFTYGVETSAPFQSRRHEPTRQRRDRCGRLYCRGTFGVIIKQNETVKLGTVIKKKTYSVPPHATTVDVEFYAAQKDEPLYTDDPCCRKIGTLTISIPIPSEDERRVDVEYIFGNTEIGVRAKETKYKKEATAILVFD